jgi:hypothetical protein
VTKLSHYPKQLIFPSAHSNPTPHPAGRNQLAVAICHFHHAGINRRLLAAEPRNESRCRERYLYSPPRDSLDFSLSARILRAVNAHLRRDMFTGFVNSVEYRQRSGGSGSRPAIFRFCGILRESLKDSLRALK